LAKDVAQGGSGEPSTAQASALQRKSARSMSPLGVAPSI